MNNTQITRQTHNRVGNNSNVMVKNNTNESGFDHKAEPMKYVCDKLGVKSNGACLFFDKLVPQKPQSEKLGDTQKLELANLITICHVAINTKGNEKFCKELEIHLPVILKSIFKIDVQESIELAKNFLLLFTHRDGGKHDAYCSTVRLLKNYSRDTITDSETKKSVLKRDMVKVNIQDRFNENFGKYVISFSNIVPQQVAAVNHNNNNQEATDKADIYKKFAEQSVQLRKYDIATEYNSRSAREYETNGKVEEAAKQYETATRYIDVNISDTKAKDLLLQQKATFYENAAKCYTNLAESAKDNQAITDNYKKAAEKYEQAAKHHLGRTDGIRDYLRCYQLALDQYKNIGFPIDNDITSAKEINEKISDCYLNMAEECQIKSTEVSNLRQVRSEEVQDYANQAGGHYKNLALHKAKNGSKESVDYYKKAAMLYEKANQPEKASECYVSAAEQYKKENKPEKAADCYTFAAKQYEKAKNPEKAAECYVSAANRSKKLTEKVECYSRAIDKYIIDKSYDNVIKFLGIVRDILTQIKSNDSEKYDSLINNHLPDLTALPFDKMSLEQRGQCYEIIADISDDDLFNIYSAQSYKEAAEKYSTKNDTIDNAISCYQSAVKQYKTAIFGFDNEVLKDNFNTHRTICLANLHKLEAKKFQNEGSNYKAYASYLKAANYYEDVKDIQAAKECDNLASQALEQSNIGIQQDEDGNEKKAGKNKSLHSQSTPELGQNQPLTERSKISDQIEDSNVQNYIKQADVHQMNGDFMHSARLNEKIARYYSTKNAPNSMKLYYSKAATNYKQVQDTPSMNRCQKLAK